MAVFSRAQLPRTEEVLVALVDLTGFARFSRDRDPEGIWSTLESFYARVERAAAESGGEVLKFMGDAALLAWPAESADAGANALLSLKNAVDRDHEAAGVAMRLLVRANAGPVRLVLTGPGKKDRLDAFGETVNIAAMLECHGVSFAPAAFRALEPETRRAFKKHTPAVRYIAAGEPHRDGKR